MSILVTKGKYYLDDFILWFFLFLLAFFIHEIKKVSFLNNLGLSFLNYPDVFCDIALL